MMFKRVFIEKDALDYEVARKIKNKFEAQNIPVKLINSHQGVRGIPGENRKEEYMESKRTLVVGIRKSKKFQTCKPSAHYQLPIATSCPGMCQYCYLNTNLGKKPYIRTYVNIDEILETAKKYIKERSPDETVFEGAATSDPLPVEELTGNLNKSIKFFALENLAKFRFATKFTNVDSLLKLDHGKSTKIRFSVNTDYIIKRYEKNTPNLEKRLDTASKVALAGYPLGFLIAPIIIYPGWQEDYEKLLLNIEKKTGNIGVTFELITHRFTVKAKNLINETFPDNKLPMDEKKRKFKYGQFGYGKYLYPPETIFDLKKWFCDKIEETVSNKVIEYFI